MVPDATRTEMGQTVPICGIELEFPDIQGVFYCTLTARNQGRCGKPTCHKHHVMPNYRISDKNKAPVSETAADPEDIFGRSITVRYLEPETNHWELWNHFKGCGDICWMNIPCDTWTGKPLGYAYVTFTESLGARRAICLTSTRLVGSLIDVRPKERLMTDGFTPPSEPTKAFTIRFFSGGFHMATDMEEPMEIPELLELLKKNETEARKPRTVLVSPVSYNEVTDLGLHFAVFGQAESINEVPGDSQAVALTFADVEHARAALQLSGVAYNGHVISVKPAAPSTVQEEPRSPKRNDFMEHLTYVVDVFLASTARAELIAVGKFVAEGGDLSTVGDHRGLDKCACDKCEIQQKLMKVGAILAQAHTSYANAEPDDSSDECEGC